MAEMESVYCAVRTDSLNETVYSLSLKLVFSIPKCYNI